MKRRVLTIILTIILALGLLAAPLAAKAQPAAKVPRIGVLLAGAPGDVKVVEAFRQGFRELGYVDGQNLAIEYRWAEGKTARVPLLAAELVHLNVDVIVTQGEAAARSVKEATHTIPIVMATSGDPVGAGLVASLPRPGGNVTGLSVMALDFTGKQMQLLKEAIPKVSRVAILYNPAIATGVLFVKRAQTSAPALGLTVQPLAERSAGDLVLAFETMTRERAQAVFVGGDPYTLTERKRILDLAAARRLPVMSQWREFADSGALMCYGPSIADMFGRAATFVDKILKGAKPADLPVEQPTKFELVINLKTAKALGLTIPPSVLARADEVIE